MDHQAKQNALDFSDPAQFESGIELQWPRANVDQNKLKLQPIMSNGEMKIRRQLEMDIETELEQEIKDGICHLALRLHRLYQHQVERNIAREAFESGGKNLQERRKKTLSEVNISIKLEGGTKIEIKETKKEVSARWDNLQGQLIACDNTNKKLDWQKSLRSTSSIPPMAANRKQNERSSQGKSSRKNDQILYLNAKYCDNARGKLATSSAKPKENANKALELGWKW